MAKKTPPTLLSFALAEGLTPARMCAVCRIGDPALIKVVDDNERLPKNHPEKVSRRIVSAYLKKFTHSYVSVDAIQGHAARHLQEPHERD